MEDIQIIELYWKRNEAAISETAEKYGAFCFRIAKNIVSLDEDAEECVSDTYCQAWNGMPPQRPQLLRAWLGRVTRNIALNLWHKNRAQKRYAGMESLLNELEECIPASDCVENELEDRELEELLDDWLFALSREDRVLFLRRYWNGEEVKKLAVEWGISPAKMAKRMYRLRQELKDRLEKEGRPL